MFDFGLAKQEDIAREKKIRIATPVFKFGVLGIIPHRHGLETVDEGDGSDGVALLNGV